MTETAAMSEENVTEVTEENEVIEVIGETARQIEETVEDRDHHTTDRPAVNTMILIPPVEITEQRKGRTDILADETTVSGTGIGAHAEGTTTDVVVVEVEVVAETEEICLMNEEVVVEIAVQEKIETNSPRKHEEGKKVLNQQRRESQPQTSQM